MILILIVIRLWRSWSSRRCRNSSNSLGSVTPPLWPQFYFGLLSSLCEQRRQLVGWFRSARDLMRAGLDASPAARQRIVGRGCSWRV
jgi:hypothetical protein